MDLQSKKEKERYDKKAKVNPLEVGDPVYEKQNVIPTKLTPEWIDPPSKVVKRCKSPRGVEGHTYVVERPDGSQHRRNVEQLKPVKADLAEEVPQDKTVKKKQKFPAPRIYWDSDSDEELPRRPNTRSVSKATRAAAGPAAAVQPQSGLLLIISHSFCQLKIEEPYF